MNAWRRIALIALHLTILAAAASILFPHLAWWVKGGEYLSIEESTAAIVELESDDTLVINDPEKENRTKAMSRIMEACKITAHPLLSINALLIIGGASAISLVLVTIPHKMRREETTDD